MAEDSDMSWALPEEAGFTADGLDRVDSLVRQYVPERISGLVYTVGRREEVIQPRAFGFAMKEPRMIPAAPDTIFDLASLTKVIATTTAAMIALESGLFRLDDAVGKHIPEFRGPGKEKIRVRHLMTHTSGIPAWVDLASACAHGQTAMEALGGLKLEYETGTKVVYSCLGYILLAELIERTSGVEFSQFCQERIFSPLGMRDTVFRPSRDLLPRIAATEYDQAGGIVLHGVVHDENARFLGGVSGNAGLFSCASDLSVFARMILNRGTYNGARILSYASVRTMSELHTPMLNESRGLGWQIKGMGEYSSAGDLMSPSSIGHTGFTGTSLWIDPQSELFVILLTNRVHLSRDNDAHIKLRPLFHNVVMGALKS